MDTAFEIAVGDRFAGLVVHKAQLARANAYYHQIHPTEAAAAKARPAEGALPT
jgi:NADH-quinone oxidoreductase subunit I